MYSACRTWSMEGLLKAGDYDALATLCEEEELMVNEEREMREKEWGWYEVLEWPFSSSCVCVWLIRHPLLFLLLFHPQYITLPVAPSHPSFPLPSSLSSVLREWRVQSSTVLSWAYTSCRMNCECVHEEACGSSHFQLLGAVWLS